MRMAMMKPNCLPVAERTADGPALVAPTKGGAWREDAAGDIPSKITEAMLLLHHHPATLTQATSCPSVASVLKTSVKGEGGHREEWQSGRSEEEDKTLSFIFILAWTWSDAGYKRFAQEGLFLSFLF